jgi:hypothetical protein
MSSLAEDEKLRRRFLRWVLGAKAGGTTYVLEQALPGDAIQYSTQEAERRGLPDGCITDGDSWALIIESKIAAAIEAEQLTRHMRTARRRGFNDLTLLLVSVGEFAGRLPRDVIATTWAKVYRWLIGQTANSNWAKRCVEYMEVLEARESASGYLQEGTLTVFSGIPFGEGDPYNYLNARRLIGLLRRELVADRRLERRLNADLDAKGRGAITGRSGTLVWDFLRIRGAKNDALFTEHPHLTFAIHHDQVDATVTVPNSVKPSIRNKLLGPTVEDFRSAIQTAAQDFEGLIQRVPEVQPQVSVLQRHYRSQKSPATIDCSLRFDVRTALPRNSRSLGKVKPQPQWVEAAYSALASRRSNIQFQIGAAFPFRTCSIVRTPEIARALADVWLSCESIVKRMLAGDS